MSEGLNPELPGSPSDLLTIYLLWTSNNRVSPRQNRIIHKKKRRIRKNSPKMGLLSLLTLGKRTMQGVSQGFPWGSLFLAVWPCEIRPSLMAGSWVYSSVCEGQLQVHWIVYLKLVGTNSRQQATTFRHQISCLERHSKKQYKDIDYLKVAHWLFFTGPVTSWTNLFSWWCSAVWYFLYYWFLDGSHLAIVIDV